MKRPDYGPRKFTWVLWYSRPAGQPRRASLTHKAGTVAGTTACGRKVGWDAKTSFKTISEATDGGHFCWHCFVVARRLVTQEATP